ncbi:sushi, nidogen and EGF-like domain-containing protein 1 [Biomphalaria glabrata]|uniref:Sushi, nidogen and EGF-like domain-containing protein 1 n=1 Tax=Biomphalaria glabrata TaxID=6526 RepID=A0A9W3AGD4_BIOGL|nr:sushi, nidogen and EGF-like domain-containing protein 1 [Biomphalaria glabrata]XP_055886338.1 sushi, nidogen and EGF-like domain-containing protein 1 [Biomphalaria glabrata]XP_055886339.1 sushi, nidogen and EGF-like domain-containing protein 1 [Biomphalaria glabrata]XP_055886340.1 sushi, nidogen and EGF-like domain-containing protein 1 [Biomphalaria glabrata]XP_055886341.1 sushi, nidogen and EGF-like domain-containing protein 1 [Biomphalaria glabrata]XP_055886342.1 sushi, nidogen and EGF-li
MMRLLILTLCFHLGVGTISWPLPYGVLASDSQIDSSDLAVVSFSPSFPFYGNTYNSVTIQKDGFLVFGTSTKKVYSDLANVNNVLLPSLGVWVSDIQAGKVFYRLSTDVTLLNGLALMSRRFSDFSATFTPRYALIVTWFEVGTAHYSFEGDFKTNTFQVVLTTDGTQSGVIMFFDTIEWVVFEDITNYAAYTDIESFPPEITISTKVGFFKGDGATKVLFPLSMTKFLKRITLDSNVGEAGVYVLRIDSSPVNVTFAPTTLSPVTVETTTTNQASYQRVFLTLTFLGTLFVILARSKLTDF